MITHAGRWENTRKACKSLAEDGNSVTCHAWFFEELHRKLNSSGNTSHSWVAGPSKVLNILCRHFFGLQECRVWKIVVDFFFHNNINFWFHAKFLGKSRVTCYVIPIFGEWFTSFSRVLPTSRVGYHAGNPIESEVYCYYKITLSKTENVSVLYEFTGTINHKFSTNQNARTILVIL